jgi:hypothetical protein
MTLPAVIVRETVISMVINSMISVGVFLLLFGIDRPVSPTALGWDFLPQSFMIALMGTMVPAVLLRKRLGTSLGRILLCSLTIAIAATVIFGGLAAALMHRLFAGSIAADQALLLKLGYGAALAAIVTPTALLIHARKSGSPT